MFFWVGFGNAQKRMLNLDCRCSIVVDYMFRELLEGFCVTYIANKREEIAHAKAEIDANLAFLRGQLDGSKEELAKPPSGEGEDTPGETVEPSDQSQTPELSEEMKEEISEKISKLEEMLKTRQFQEQALDEAAEKVRNASLDEIDVCDDTGTALGLQGMGSVAAADIIEPRSSYTLCRRIKPDVEQGGKASKGDAAGNEKTVMISFAVPPDDSVNLELLLGPSRITVQKKTKKGKGRSARNRKGHRRSITENPKGKGRSRGLKDITNQNNAASSHRRSRTSL